MKKPSKWNSNKEMRTGHSSSCCKIKMRFLQLVSIKCMKMRPSWLFCNASSKKVKHSTSTITQTNFS